MKPTNVEIRKAILKLMEFPMTTTDVSNVTGFSYPACRKALHFLFEAGNLHSSASIRGTLQYHKADMVHPTLPNHLSKIDIEKAAENRKAVSDDERKSFDVPERTDIPAFFEDAPKILEDDEDG